MAMGCLFVLCLYSQCEHNIIWFCSRLRLTYRKVMLLHKCLQGQCVKY